MDSKAFKSIVLPLGRKLFNFARMMLEDNDEAQDAVQEVFLKLWNYRNKMESVKNIEAFAMKITKNWCIDRMKSKKPVYIESYNRGYDFQKETSNPHKILQSSDTMKELNDIINKLPEQQRMIIQLRDVEGYEFEEIAEILNTNVNTVRVNLSRARNKIKDILINIKYYEIRKN
jgi:RNA polymerase sigma factor (sigma-70 family)